MTPLLPGLVASTMTPRRMRAAHPKPTTMPAMARPVAALGPPGLPDLRAGDEAEDHPGHRGMTRMPAHEQISEAMAKPLVFWAGPP